MSKILLVDDEKNFCTVLKQILTIKGHEVDVFATVSDALESIEKVKYDLVVSDIRMQPLSGLFLLQELNGSHPELPVIMMTAYASVDTALDALKMGAFDYLTKPFKVEEFLDVIDRALMSSNELVSTSEMENIVKENCFFDCILCVSKSMKESCKMIELVAPTDTSVLLLGQAGTGRTLFAQAIHNHSSRKDMSCLVLNCAELSDEKTAPDIFIGKAGNPNDVNSSGSGILGADGGTLILENIENMAIIVQRMLLDVICKKQVFPEGKEPVNVNVRILATSSACLDTAIKEGRFLDELYRRISLISINICPLSERREDILPLAWFFLSQLAKEGEEIPAISADVRGALQHYIWPGNVAELRGVVKYLFEHKDNNMITRNSLPPHLLNTISDKKSDAGNAAESNKAKSLKEYLSRKGVDPDKIDE